MSCAYHRLIKCVLCVWFLLVKIEKLVHLLKDFDRIALTGPVFGLKVEIRSRVYCGLVVGRLMFFGPAPRFPSCSLILLLRIDGMFVFHVCVHGWITEISSLAHLAFIIASVFFVTRPSVLFCVHFVSLLRRACN